MSGMKMDADAYNPTPDFLPHVGGKGTGLRDVGEAKLRLDVQRGWG